MRFVVQRHKEEWIEGESLVDTFIAMNFSVDSDIGLELTSLCDFFVSLWLCGES